MIQLRNSETAPPRTLCPVCQSPKATTFDQFPVRDLRTEFLRQAGIDVIAEFPKDLESIDLKQCMECGLQYYVPLCPGSEDFYAQLAGLDSYYCRRRWEFERALELLGERDRVVDVGCGDGQFLSLLPGRDKRGLEFNPAAVARARARGLDVSRGALRELAPGSADVVTLFQVLEHVSQPISLLAEALAVLPPGGRLVIAVPNNDGFIGDVIQNPLNAPPHHVLRWREAALRYLSGLLPMRLERLELEPLSTDHLFLYRKTCITRYVGRTLKWTVPRMRRTKGTVLLNKAANAVTRVSLALSKRLPKDEALGQSLLAIYVRT